MLERPAIRCASRPPLLAQSRGDGSLFPPPERALGRNNSRLPTVVAPGCVTVICVLCAVGARLALPPPRSCRRYFITSGNGKPGRQICRKRRAFLSFHLITGQLVCSVKPNENSLMMNSLKYKSSKPVVASQAAGADEQCRSLEA
eukprot:scaffold71598_cov50-Phaeocystis_antarctica.AAC.1